MLAAPSAQLLENHVDLVGEDRLAAPCPLFELGARLGAPPLRCSYRLTPLLVCTPLLLTRRLNFALLLLPALLWMIPVLGHYRAVCDRISAA